MKLIYPAEAFALGIILFSSGMKEAFTAGILVILSMVFAEFLKNLLESLVPDWSLQLCVYIASGAISSSVFLLGFASTGTELTVGIWIMTFFIGILCARHALSNTVDADYDTLFWEAAVAWGFWILLAILREFMGNGQIFGNVLLEAEFQSKVFLGSTFAFLTAGLVLAFTNGILKKSCSDLNSLWVVIPAAILVRPFTIASLTGLAEYAGIALTIAVPILLFLSVKRTIRFSRAGKYYRGLPVELMSAGFIYMILSIY